MKLNRVLSLLMLGATPLLAFEAFNEVRSIQARATEVRAMADSTLRLLEDEQTRILDNLHVSLPLLGRLVAARGIEGACREALGGAGMPTPDYVVVEVSTPGGTVACSTRPESVGAVVGDQPTFKRALATDGIVFGTHSHGIGIGGPVLPFCLRVTDGDGRAVAVVAGLIDLRRLADHLADKPLPANSSVILVHQDGTVLARTPEVDGVVGRRLPDRYGWLLESSERQVAEVVGLDGVARVVAASPPPIGVPGMALAVGFDKAAAMRQAYVASALSLASFTGLLALTAAAGAFGVRRFVDLRRRADAAAIRMKAVMESSPNAVFGIDREWRLTLLNAKARAVLARGADAVGMDMREAMPDLVAADAVDRIRHTLDTGDAVEFEAPVGSDGAWHGVRAFPSGNGVAVTLWDVTARRRAEEELRRSEARLSLAVASAEAGTFEWDAATGEIEWSERSFRIFGVPPRQGRVGFDAWLLAVHPDDRQAVLHSGLEPLEGSADMVRAEYRVVHPDGAVRWVESIGSIRRNADGRPLRVVGLDFDVTERKMAAEAARIDRDRLRLALAAASAGAWDWDVRTGEVACSEGMLSQYGLDTAGGRIAHGGWMARIAAADRGEVEEAVAGALARGEGGYSFEARIDHPVEGERWCEVTASVYRAADGSPERVVGISLDVTGRKLLERRLRDAMEHMEVAMAAARASAWEWDARSDSLRIAREYSADRGRAASGSVAVSTEEWLAMVHPEDRERVRKVVADTVAQGSGAYRNEFRVPRQDGGVRWIAAIGRIEYGHDGAPTRAVGIEIDVTETKSLELALREAKAEAERANAAKTRLIAAASHDLRQPLQALSFLVGAARNHVDPKGAETLDAVGRGLDTLGSLLSGLLDLARIDAGAVRPQVTDIPLDEVLDDIGVAYAPVAAGKGVDFRVEDACVRAVRTDRMMLGRMLRNLVDNALRHTESGAVGVVCRVEDADAVIEVHDTGVGIPGDHLDRIWDEFHKVGDGPGLGVGLSLVRRMADMLGHPVAVRSEPGRGSVFSVRVPLGVGQARAPLPAPAAPDGGERFAVLIDDDAIVLMGVQAILEAWGYRTLDASSTDEAMARLADDGRRPDIVIVDYRLRQGRTGTEAVVRIRRMFGPSVPCVILTGEHGQEPQHEAAALGIDVVFKPISPTELSALLERHIGPAWRPAAAAD